MLHKSGQPAGAVQKVDGVSRRGSVHNHAVKPVVVNGLWPEVDGLAAALEELETSNGSGSADAVAADAARHRLARVASQQAEVARLSGELPLPQIHLPFLFRSGFGPTELGELADVLAAGTAPIETGRS